MRRVATCTATVLFERWEFDHMKRVIIDELKMK